jgi:hypothetical protein
MKLVKKPVLPTGTGSRRGVDVGEYETTIPAKEADAAPGGAKADGLDLGPALQSCVTIHFEVDDHHPLRRLVVTYKHDDRSNRLTATLDNFGERVKIEKPPESDIYCG